MPLRKNSKKQSDMTDSDSKTVDAMSNTIECQQESDNCKERDDDNDDNVDDDDDGDDNDNDNNDDDETQDAWLESLGVENSEIKKINHSQVCINIVYLFSICPNIMTDFRRE